MPPDALPLSFQIADWVLTIGSLGIWILVFRRWRRGGPIVPHEPRRPVPWHGVDLILILLTFLVLVGLAQHVLLRIDPSLAGPEDVKAAAASRNDSAPQAPAETASAKTEVRAKTMGPTALAAMIIAELLMLVVAIGWVAFRVRATPRDLGFDLSHLGTDLMLGGAAFLALIVPISVLEKFLEHYIPYDHDVVKLFTKNPSVSVFILSGVATVLVAPLAEEFFFRVLLQGLFEAVEFKRRLLELTGSTLIPEIPSARGNFPVGEAGDDNPYRSPSAPVPVAVTEAQFAAASAPAAWPIILSAILFAMMHWGQGPAPIPLFFFALALGYVYQRTHRIWPSILAHMLLNGTSMAMLWFIVKNAAK